MQAAVSWGFVFSCDPLAFLDRDESEYPLLMAVLHEADRRARESQKGAENG